MTSPSSEAERIAEGLYEMCEYLAASKFIPEQERPVKIKQAIVQALSQRERETAKKCAGIAKKHKRLLILSKGDEEYFYRDVAVRKQMGKEIATAIRQAFGVGG